MFFIMMSLISILSYNFISSQAPLLMAMVLIVSTVILSSLTALVSMNSWFSYILMMIFISGMMIIFVYISSVAANETYSASTDKNSYAALTGACVWLLVNSHHYFNNSMALNKDTCNSFNPATEIFTSKVLSTLYSFMTVGLMVYLLLALVASVKISVFLKSPLRTSF